MYCQQPGALCHSTPHAAQVTNERFWMPAWPIVELLTGSAFQLAADVRVVKDFAMHIINKRRQQLASAAVAGLPAGSNGEAAGDGDVAPGRDLLSLFMADKGPDGKSLTDQQLVDTVLNFIIAGRDTTAQVTISRILT